MAKTAKLFIEFIGKDKGATKTSKEVLSAADKVDRRLKQAAGAVAVGAIAKGAFDQAQEAQKVAARTAAVLRSTKGESGKSAAEVERLADAISGAAGVDDEYVQSVENVLLGTKNLGAVFDRTTQAAIDWAAATGTDAVTAAGTLGKALQDPVAGMTRLRKAGVILSESQKATIANFVKQGETAKAQGVILGEVERKFGGSAAAMATDADRAKVAWENAQEALGEALLPAVNSLLKPVTRLTSAFAKQDKALRSVEVSAAATLAAYAKFGPIGLAIGTLVTGMEAWSELSKGSDVSSFEDDTDAIVHKLDEVNKAYEDSARYSLDMVLNFGRNSRTMAGEIDSLDDKWATSVAHGGAAAAEAKANYARVAAAAIASGVDAQTVALWFDDYWRAVEGGGYIGGVVKNIEGKAKPAVDALGQAGEDAGKKAEKAWKDYQDTLADDSKAKGAQSDFEKAFTGQSDQQQAAMDVVDGIQAVGATIRQNGANFDIATDKGEENRKAYIDARDSIIAYVEALQATGKYSNTELKRIMEDQVRQLDNTARGAGATEGQIAALKGEMGLLPKNIDIAFNTPGWDTATKHFQDILEKYLTAIALADELENRWKARATVPTRNPDSFGGGFGGGSTGGNVQSIFGVTVPAGNAAGSKSPGGRSIGTVNIYAKGTDARDVVRRLDAMIPAGTS